MKATDFELIADVIGPQPGPSRDALRAYYVNHQRKASCAAMSGMSRAAITQFVARWDAYLATLTAVNWTAVKKGLPGGPRITQPKGTDQS